MKVMRLCVMGMGYIGLPTASMFAAAGLEILGVDTKPEVVATLQAGGLHLEEPGLRTLVEDAVRSGRLQVSLTAGPADAFIIAVPTPITGNHGAEMGMVLSACDAIAPHLKPGNLVVLESTSPPGTTRDLLAPRLEAATGLKAGVDFHLGHCPERVLPGRILVELAENHRVVGGLTPACAEAAESLYRRIAQGGIHRTDATTAELVKLMENTYRDVNIALANELGLLGERLGVDAWEVVRLANLHPRVQLHQPGPGVGGHCISVDPWFLVEAAPELTRLIRTAREVNDAQPSHVVRQAMAMLAGVKAPKVALLGVAYKGDVDDARESPAEAVVHGLQSSGVAVACHDPHVRRWVYPLQPLDEALTDADLVLLVAPHQDYLRLNLAEVKSACRGLRVLDTRSFLSGAEWGKAGFHFCKLGQVPKPSLVT